MKQWQCSACKYIHTGDAPPEKCPVCGVSGSKFVLYEGESAPEAELNTPDEPSSENGSRAAVYVEKAANLMVKHHAHPMSVHLPNGVIPVIAALVIISWLSGSAPLAKAGFINLVFVLIALPLVGLTGFFEWKKKYNQAKTTLFKIKIAAATVAAICCITSFIWYLVNPEVLVSPRAWLFVMINLLMLAGVGVAGHMGGKLVFKD